MRAGPQVPWQAPVVSLPPRPLGYAAAAFRAWGQDVGRTGADSLLPALSPAPRAASASAAPGAAGPLSLLGAQNPPFHPLVSRPDAREATGPASSQPDMATHPHGPPHLTPPSKGPLHTQSSACPPCVARNPDGVPLLLHPILPETLNKRLPLCTVAPLVQQATVRQPPHPHGSAPTPLSSESSTEIGRAHV